MTAKKRLLNIIEYICIFALAFGIVFLIVNFILDARSKKALEDIRAGIKAARIQSQQITIPDDGRKESTETSEAEEIVYIRPEKSSSVILEEYKKIYEDNSNFAGWLYVSGTEIDYPYMQGPDNAFYLSHNIDRTYDKYGMLIMDYNCSTAFDSPHLIVYGHNVNSGRLFGELLKFKEEAYYKYHPDMNFDTINEAGVYTIFAAFTTTVEEAQKEHGLFTTWGFKDKEEFDRVTGWAIGKSLYDTGVVPEYGSPVLSLVTCEHSRDEGRFVLMATKILD